MRNVIVSEFVTLDGVIEAPEQWSFQFGRDDDMPANMRSGLAEEDAILLGRVTYDKR